MIIAVTPGDPAGIGPEITWKTIQHHEDRGVTLLCVGAKAPFEKLGAPIVETSLQELKKGPPRNRSKKPFVWLLAAPAQVPTQRRGSLLLEGYQSGWAIETSVRLIQKKLVSAMATGPISKERLQAGGFPYPGHTELLASLCRKKNVTMMLANDLLRVTLVTIHLSLKDVPDAITRSEVRRTILHTVSHLRNWWGIQRPRIAVAALNPHAGEGGLFGSEDQRIVGPEIAALQKKAQGAYLLDGPLPADTLFAKHLIASPRDRYDAVVCMYHDQGLIPVKLLDFSKTVNVTLGLPIVRTSVDHGVGFDIAGMGKADPSSLQAAIQLAAQIVKNKRKQGTS